METKTIADIKEADEGIKYDPDWIGSMKPDIIQKDGLADRIQDYWCDSVIPDLKGEWFQISRERNKIIIQPVTISYPESNGC